MSEFITIQVGQCGNQIGSAFWPLVLQEYGISKFSSNNERKYDFQSAFRSFFTAPDGKLSNFRTFADLKSAKVKARTILIDMEDGVVSRIKTGSLRFLYDEKATVTNYPGSGNNWAEGYCSHGPAYEDKILDVIRRCVENCDNLHGFLLMFSTGGGTGSGVGTYVLKLLADYYPLIDRFAICVYPIGTEDVITCPYNMALCTKKLSEFANCVFPVENRALLEIVNKQSKNSHSIDTMSFVARCKPFQDMNSIIANMFLHLSSGSRFPGNLNVDLNEINTNMVPFPNMQYIASSFSPLTMPSDKKKPMQVTKQVKDQLFISTCGRSNQLLKIDCIGINSILLGSTLIGRGDYTVSDMRFYVERLQSKAKFTHWSKKAIKVGLCDIAPSGHDITLLALFNTTGMATLFTNIYSHFIKLYEKKKMYCNVCSDWTGVSWMIAAVRHDRFDIYTVIFMQVYNRAFPVGTFRPRSDKNWMTVMAHVHHYNNVSGFDHMYFEECQENLLSNINSYQDCDLLQENSIPRLSVLVE